MLEYLHVECAPPMVHLVSHKGFEGLKVVSLCTDDDILIEVIFVYIFSLKPFGFWRRQFIESVYVSLETLWIWIRQFIESVYVFPETRWILETPIH